MRGLARLLCARRNFFEFELKAAPLRVRQDQGHPAGGEFAERLPIRDGRPLHAELVRALRRAAPSGAVNHVDYLGDCEHGRKL